MTPKTKEYIEQIFEKRRIADAPAETRDVKDMPTKEDALRKFEAMRGTVLRAAMEEVGALVKANGYNFAISEVPDDPERGVNAVPRITMFLSWTSEAPDPSAPKGCSQFSVEFNKFRGHVNFTQIKVGRTGGGSQKSLGSMPVDEVTSERLQSEIAGAIGEIYG
jgi:hypothetical protein